MSDRPTPETDKIITDWMQGVTKELPNFVEIARNLERERDEAIRQRDETNRSSKYACDYNYEQKLKAERERDEAREKYDTLATEHMLEVNKLCNERDEAREILRELYFAVQRKFAEWAPKNNINAASEEAAK